MVKYKNSSNNSNHRKTTPNNNKNNNKKEKKGYKRLATMGKVSTNLINELYYPLDAVNRFLNLALQSTDDDSQNRQFLLESKSGVRKMLTLVKRLNDYAQKMEKEMMKVLWK